MKSSLFHSVLKTCWKTHVVKNLINFCLQKEKEKSEKSIFSKVKLKSKKKEGNDAFENPVYSVSDCQVGILVSC